MTDKLEYKAVMYTDGSAQPNPGPYGGGCHGYLYTDTDYRRNADAPNGYAVTEYGYKEKHEVIVKDGVSTPADVKPSFYYNAVYAYGSNGTSNKAELKAVTDTINILSGEYNVTDILIYTDSTYVLSVHKTVSSDLSHRSWLSTDRPNLDLWIALADALAAATATNIVLKKIAAHGTAVGNNTADRLAYAAREMASNNNIVSMHKEYPGRYWKDKPIPHPLLNFKQTYFNVGIIPDSDEHMYVIMDYPKDVELGNKSSEPLFGVSIFKEGVSSVDGPIQAYLANTNGLKTLAAVDLRVVHTQTFSKMTALLGDAAYNRTKNRKLMLLDEDTVVTPIVPAGLAQSAVKRTLEMYKLFKHHMATGGKDDGVSVSIDITDQLYDVNDKGKFVFKYNQTIVGPEVDVTLDSRDINMTLVYGKDILTRNQLKKLESSKPKVYLTIFRHNDKMFEYNVLIDTNEASGIYGNYYINKFYL